MISGGSAVKPVNLLIWIVAALSIAFVIINWGMLVAPIQASFGFTRVSVPLGVVLLGLAIVLIAVFFGLLLTVQFRLMAMHRRHSAELRTQRELVENAEASRFTELRQYLQQELVSLREAQRASEQRLREEILATSNTLAACVGEIDERLERQWPSAPEQQP
jgi:uncharacterized integral membrane protein